MLLQTVDKPCTSAEQYHILSCASYNLQLLGLLHTDGFYVVRMKRTLTCTARYGPPEPCARGYSSCR